MPRPRKIGEKQRLELLEYLIKKKWVVVKGDRIEKAPWHKKGEGTKSWVNLYNTFAEKWEVSPSTVKREVAALLKRPIPELLKKLKEGEGTIDVHASDEELKKLEAVEGYGRTLVGTRKRAIKKKGRKRREKVIIDAIRRIGKKPENWTLHDLAKLRAYEICRLFPPPDNNCTWEYVLERWNDPRLYSYVGVLRDFVAHGLKKPDWWVKEDPELNVLPLIMPPKHSAQVFTTSPKEIQAIWERLEEMREKAKKGAVIVNAPKFKRLTKKIKPLDCKIALKSYKYVLVPDKSRKLRLTAREVDEINVIGRVKPTTGIRTGDREEKKELWGTRVLPRLGEQNESWIWFTGNTVRRWHVFAKWDEMWEITTVPASVWEELNNYIRKYDRVGKWLLEIDKGKASTVFRVLWLLAGNQYAKSLGSKFKPLHAFRKAYIQLFSYAGVDLLDAIKLNVGWKDPKTAVGWYLFVNPELSERKYEKVAKLFNDRTAVLEGKEAQEEALRKAAEELLGGK